MSPFFEHNAGMIELGLVEGIVVLLAVRELWSIRRTRRQDLARKEALAQQDPQGESAAQDSAPPHDR